LEYSLSFNILFSPTIIRAIKTRTMRWVGHEACLGVMDSRLYIQNFSRTIWLEDLDEDGRIIMEWSKINMTWGYVWLGTSLTAE
jgi:hypothetical protein